MQLIPYTSKFKFLKLLNCFYYEVRICGSNFLLLEFIISPLYSEYNIYSEKRFFAAISCIYMKCSKRIPVKSILVDIMSSWDYTKRREFFPGCRM